MAKMVLSRATRNMDTMAERMTSQNLMVLGLYKSSASSLGVGFSEGGLELSTTTGGVSLIMSSEVRECCDCRGDIVKPFMAVVVSEVVMGCVCCVEVVNGNGITRREDDGI